MKVSSDNVLIGGVLSFIPCYGTGWIHLDTSGRPVIGAPDESRGGPLEFKSVLKENKLGLDSEIIGGLTVIQTPGHEFHDYWCVFLQRSLRCSKPLNLRAGDFHFFVRIQKNRPRFRARENAHVMECLSNFEPSYFGYATVAEEGEWLSHARQVYQFNRRANF